MLSVGAQAFHGAIYAPRAHVAYVGATHVEGSLFARSLRGVGVLDIEHGATGPSDPGECDDPEDPQDPEAPDDPPDPDGEPDDEPEDPNTPEPL